MTIDTRPAPRLPLDTADTVSYQRGKLGAMLVFEPGEPVYQWSLLETQTPLYWAGAFDRQVYNKSIVLVFDGVGNAEVQANPVLDEFAKQEPKPPQSRGTG